MNRNRVFLLNRFYVSRSRPIYIYLNGKLSLVSIFKLYLEGIYFTIRYILSISYLISYILDIIWRTFPCRAHCKEYKFTVISILPCVEFKRVSFGRSCAWRCIEHVDSGYWNLLLVIFRWTFVFRAVKVFSLENRVNLCLIFMRHRKLRIVIYRNCHLACHLPSASSFVSSASFRAARNPHNSTPFLTPTFFTARRTEHYFSLIKTLPATLSV